MLQAKRSFLVAATGILIFLVANLQTAQGAESGCVTCHLDKEMLQKTVTVAKGQKSAKQSGAG